MATDSSSSSLATYDDSPERLADAIKARLDLRTCRFEPFPFDALMPRIEPDRIVLPPDEPGLRSYASWRPDDGVELTVHYGPLTLGRFVLVPHTPTCGVAIPRCSRTAAIAIARRAGDALGRRWALSERCASAQREEDPRV
jgi:hypothetical protein